MYINELIIYTSQLEKQLEFYSSVLHLRPFARSEEKVSFQIGHSILTFEARDRVTPYHFAINIPANKELEALTWLKRRVDVLKDDVIELHDFDFWNAKAMYFYDPDRNIVELIARKNLSNESEQAFSSDQFLCISEIGLPTLDIKTKFDFLHTLSGIEPFSGDLERFLAIGDEHGLFICINKKRKDWFPTGDSAFSSDFEMYFTNNGQRFGIRFQNDELIVSS